ncbi:PDZ domain-containing protein [Paenibacillus daejeonensis]|uniref:PDZ domain-containing protein n=1 Tax=Paenibacillus daejeonensis TaxID=135193 RepID=UPI0012FAD59A|nr:PDZ domain-containing protein [Paenibacillus daejeonensis]
MTEVLYQLGAAVLQLIMQPFFYIALGLIILIYRYQMQVEQRLFHARLHPWLLETGRSLAGGVAVGLLVSVVAAFIGVGLTPDTALWVWGTAGLLLLLRIRWLCLAYSVGLLGLLQGAVHWLDPQTLDPLATRLVASLGALDIPGLLLLVALLHVAEALLTGWQGARLASPLVLSGKRGRLVGAYRQQGYWPVPLLLVTPAAGGFQAADAVLPWTPLLHSGEWGGGWTIVGLPVIIGFTALTRSLLPAQKARQSARQLLLYSFLLGVVAALAAWWPPLTVAAALCALVLHEVLTLISAWRESTRSPYYVHDGPGLRVLAVVPGSPAAELGIVTGEVLYKVNGLRVRTQAELHESLARSSAAFCKLEVLNLEGQSKFLQRARYEGEHHQLGIILAPDEYADQYAPAAQPSLWRLLRGGKPRRKRDTPDPLSF